MANDVFGIKKLYPSSESNSQEFVLPMHENDIDGSEGSITAEDINLFTLQDNDGNVAWWEAENDDEEGNVIIYFSPNGSADRDFSGGYH